MGKSYPSAEKQLVYSAAPANRANEIFVQRKYFMYIEHLRLQHKIILTLYLNIYSMENQIDIVLLECHQKEFIIPQNNHSYSKTGQADFSYLPHTARFHAKSLTVVNKI